MKQTGIQFLRVSNQLVSEQRLPEQHLAIQQSIEQQLNLLRDVNRLYSDAFDDHESYLQRPPSDEWLKKLLVNPMFIAIVAMDGENVVGALTAYELPKLEQQRSEIYIYDLAVSESHRRKGIAMGLISMVQDIALNCRAWVIFVQADYVDEPAVKLYEKLGEREEVLHFDIQPQKRLL